MYRKSNTRLYRKLELKNKCNQGAKIMAYKNIEDKRAYNREYDQKRRIWFKIHKCCTECGKQDAFTLMGRRRCYECKEKQKIYNQNYRKSKKS